MIVKLIYSIFFITSGYYIIKYRRVVKTWTGNFIWAEQFLGSGGTYLILILIGMGLIFLGVTYPFGVFDTIGTVPKK